MTIDLFFLVFNVLATVVLAMSGVFQAARHQMDFFGALVLACVSALGGGTVRDILINAPVFWLHDVLYLTVITLTVAITILLVRRVPPDRGIRAKLLNIADAAGLALFAILGTAKALQWGVQAPIAAVMGVITGVVGGMIRDVLTPVTPFVMRGEVYAGAAIAGCLLYVVLQPVLAEIPAMLVSMLVIFLVRLAAMYWQIQMPTVKLKH